MSFPSAVDVAIPKMVKVTNTGSKVFDGMYDSRPFKLAPSESIPLPAHIAQHLKGQADQYPKNDTGNAALRARPILHVVELQQKYVGEAEPVEYDGKVFPSQAAMISYVIEQTKAEIAGADDGDEEVADDAPKTAYSKPVHWDDVKALAAKRGIALLHRKRSAVEADLVAWDKQNLRGE